MLARMEPPSQGPKLRSVVGEFTSLARTPMPESAISETAARTRSPSRSMELHPPHSTMFPPMSRRTSGSTAIIESTSSLGRGNEPGYISATGDGSNSSSVVRNRSASTCRIVPSGSSYGTFGTFE